MDIQYKNIKDPGKQKTSCAAVLVYPRKQMSDAARALDAAHGGLVGAALAAGDIAGKPGEALLLHTSGDAVAKRILLLGVGAKSKLDAGAVRKVVDGAFKALRSSKAKDAVLYTISPARRRNWLKHTASSPPAFSKKNRCANWAWARSCLSALAASSPPN